MHIRSIYKLLLSPSGRMSRRDFWLGVAVFAILAIGFNFALRQLGNSTLAFLISLPFPFLALHMSYCIYGKRLHDMGRSFWPLTAMICSLILVAIIGMLAFGGSEFFSEFAQYERKQDIDPAIRDAIQQRYQDKLQAANAPISALMQAIIAGFTLWCGLAKSDPKDNVYGTTL